jgi:hypothetical protein
LSLIHLGFERFAGLELPFDISGSHGKKCEQYPLGRCDSNINLQTYRKLASPSSGFNMEAVVSLKLPEISTGLHVAMSEYAFFKFTGKFPSNLRIPVVNNFPLEHTPSVIMRSKNFSFFYRVLCKGVFRREYRVYEILREYINLGSILH